MGAYNYAPRTNLNYNMLYRQSVAGNAAFRRPPQKIIAPDFRAIAIVTPHEFRGTDINILPADTIFVLEESPRITAASAIAGLDQRVSHFVQAMEVRVSEGKMPGARLNELIEKISQLRNEAEQSLQRGHFDAFVETADSIGQIMVKADFLSEMYSEKLNIQVIRATIDEAHNLGALSSGDHAILRKMLSEKVRENAGALMAGDENGFMASLIELASMMEIADIIGRDLGKYREQSAEQDISAMNKTARERILPGMRSANIINQELLERNQLIIEFASRFLLELRKAQAEILSGTREQLETINKARTISEKQISEIKEAIKIVADTTEQAGISEHNESTISRELREIIWAHSPENAVNMYRDLKNRIISEQIQILAIFAEITAKTESDMGSVSNASVCMPGLGRQTDHDDSPVGRTERKIYIPETGGSVFKCLLEILEIQSEARRAALDKHAEEMAEEKLAENKRSEKKLRQKRYEAKIAEIKRRQKALAEEAESIQSFILLEMRRLENILHDTGNIIQFRTLVSARLAAASAA